MPDNIEYVIKKFFRTQKASVRTTVELDERILTDALEAQEKIVTTKTAQPEPSKWSIAMKSKKIQFTAAAVVFIAVGLGMVTFMQTGAQLAYALEQTIEAHHSVQFLHVKSYRIGQDEPKEFWLETDEHGQAKNVRMHMPAWDSPEDGPKQIVWKNNTAQVWMSKKNVLVTIKDRTVANKMLEFLALFDPALLVERLHEGEQAGLVEIEIDQPESKAEPIQITATVLPEEKQLVLLVDQATSLVTTMDVYLLSNDEYVPEDRIEFYDYNQPIDEAMFVLSDIPTNAETMVIDHTQQEVGLLQGEMTDEQVCLEVARQFLEAMITEDYARAGQLFSGIPAERMAQMMDTAKVLRIVSLGQVKPFPDPKVGGYAVAYTIEIEKDGVTSVHTGKYPLAIRQVHGQPDRWNIHGGFGG